MARKERTGKITFRRIRGRIVPIRFRGDTRELIVNPKAPKLSVKRVKGKLRVFKGSKAVSGAGKELDATIQSLRTDVIQAEAGKRIVIGTGINRRVVATPSTFPKFFREGGFRTKKDFLRGLDRGKGPVFERISQIALEDLLTNDPNFNLKSGQIFLKNVKFVTIDGIVRPIPVGKSVPKADTSFNFGQNVKVDF